MKSSEHAERPGANSVARWVAVMAKETTTDEEREQFADWLAESPQNVRMYMKQSGMTRSIVKDLLAESSQTPAVGWQKILQYWHVPAGVLICVILLFGISLTRVWPPSHIDVDASGEYIAKRVGVTCVTLEDGSIALLKEKSVVRTEMRTAKRAVVLVQGDAKFTVARNSRPFEVRAAGTAVRALGTVFSVRVLSSDRVEVIVHEGKVIVREADGAASSKVSKDDSMLSAGEGAVVQNGMVRVRFPRRSLE